jgi:Ca-activated chloride channel family protein
MPSRRLMLSVFAFLFAAFACAMSARAQGVIVPRPCERCPAPRPAVNWNLPRALPVKSIKIDTKIKGQIATTHVEQIFSNDTDVMMEGTYLFPIPESASIAEFAIWDGDKRYVGEVRSREEARRIYDEIVRKKRDPGLLEYAGKDLFQASIFPINPHSDKKLELTYTQVLKAESGTVAYRYPLGTGRNLAPIGEVAGRIEIDGGEPLRNIYSPTHQIEIVRAGAGGGRGDESRASISFEVGRNREPQDFQLFYALSKADFGLSLLTYREPGKDGYFLLMLSPKNDLAEREYAAKDIVFVIDTSGSMADEGKMEKARAALLFGIKTLHANDRFNVINFSGEEHLMENGLIAANKDGIAKGVEFVNRLTPNGGTNINSAMLTALKQFDVSARPKMIVFLTDGLPTVGETSPQRIIENVRVARPQGIRLFTFGVGYDVNTALLDKLASDNGGAPDYVEPKEDLEVKVSNFFAKVNYPVLTDLALDFGGVKTDLTYPRNLPDIFRGSQLTLIGRYRNEQDLRNTVLRLKGRTGGETREFVYENISFPSKNTENDFLPRLWATRRVGWLLEQIRTNGEQKELRDEIVDLGTRYGIVTPYTSYLAVENEAQAVTVNGVAGGVMGRDSARAVNGRRKRAAASGDKSKDTGGLYGLPSAKPAPPPPPVSATTGADAVQLSKQQRAQQEAIQIGSDDVQRLDTDREYFREGASQKIGDKTFYFHDGAWIDAEFKADAKLPETVLTFGSDGYYALVKHEPQMAKYLALGERVIVVFNDRVYRIEAAPKK